MKHQAVMRSAVRLLCGAMVFLPLMASAGDADAAPGRSTTPNGMGFEIGNGKRMVQNMNGFYGLTLPNAKWQIGFFGKFTEVFASLGDGSPRARLHINMVTAEGIQTFTDLVKQLTTRGFSVAKIAELDAVQREDALNNGRCLLDVRVFRAPKEIAVITLDGKRVDASDDCRGPSAYARIKDSLDTFEFIQ